MKVGVKRLCVHRVKSEVSSIMQNWNSLSPNRARFMLYQGECLGCVLNPSVVFKSHGLT